MDPRPEAPGPLDAQSIRFRTAHAFLPEAWAPPPHPATWTSGGWLGSIFWVPPALGLEYGDSPPQFCTPVTSRVTSALRFPSSLSLLASWIRPLRQSSLSSFHLSLLCLCLQICCLVLFSTLSMDFSILWQAFLTSKSICLVFSAWVFTWT